MPIFAEKLLVRLSEAKASLDTRSPSAHNKTTILLVRQRRTFERTWADKTLINQLPLLQHMPLTIEEMATFCKKKGFVFPSSEIYGGFAGFWDLGPLGVEMFNALKAAWWQYFVRSREDIVGLDSSIFMNPKIWEASGHVSGFSDPLSECKKCHSRIRVDHLLESVGIKADEKIGETEINKIFSENKDKIKCPDCGTYARQ